MSPVEHHEAHFISGGSCAFQRSTTPPRSAITNASIRMASLVVEVPRAVGSPLDSLLPILEALLYTNKKTPRKLEVFFLFVEVPRIELGSDDIDQGLLRAQSA